MLHRPAVSAGKMQVAAFPALTQDNLREIAELSYKPPTLQRHYNSVWTTWDMPLMGVNRDCRRIMNRIVAEKYEDIRKKFEEHVVDFAHDYLLQTSAGHFPEVKLSFYHKLRDGTNSLVEAASFQRTVCSDKEDIAIETPVLVIRYKLASPGAGRRWDMKWSTPIDERTGFHLIPAMRSQEQTENVLRIIGSVQTDMRMVLTNLREVPEARSDDEDSDTDLDSESSDHGMTSIDSDDLLENQLDAEPPDFEEEIELMLDDAEALRHQDPDSD